MAKTVIANLGGVQSKFIFYDPPSMGDETAKWLGADFTGVFLPQRGQSLGERIPNAIDDCISAGSEKVVVIGTDCVEVTGDIVSDSFERLDGTDVVIGPCEDGGYYLIGMKRSHREIFNGIDWSTERVAAQTLENTDRLSLKVSILQTLRDIDSADDLNKG